MRDCFKLTLYIVLFSFFCGCHNSRPLISNPGEYQSIDFKYIIIDAPNPLIEYQMKRTLSYKLSNYSDKLRNYTIVIKLKKESDIAAFSEKEVVKEQVRLVAYIEIFDKNKQILAKKSIDSFSTYEVNDDVPFASISSKSETINVLINDISSSIASMVLSFLRDC